MQNDTMQLNKKQPGTTTIIKIIKKKISWLCLSLSLVSPDLEAIHATITIKSLFFSKKTLRTTKNTMAVFLKNLKLFSLKINFFNIFLN
jgi:hypothetical protein